jgi:hypothetical protein
MSAANNTCLSILIMRGYLPNNTCLSVLYDFHSFQLPPAPIFQVCSYRPYFTIHDTSFGTLSSGIMPSESEPQGLPRVMGVTNLYFLKVRPLCCTTSSVQPLPPPQIGKIAYSESNFLLILTYPCLKITMIIEAACNVHCLDRHCLTGHVYNHMSNNDDVTM